MNHKDVQKRWLNALVNEQAIAERYFAPTLPAMRGEVHTYTLEFDGVESWMAFVDYIRRNGHKVYGRRLADCHMEVTSNMPKERVLAVYERFGAKNK
jgi:hypothetical protein